MLIRSFVRQTLTLRYLPAIVASGAVAFQITGPRGFEWVGTLGFILLLAGFPYAAVELVAMDRDTRLDQLRLAGWTRGRLLTAVLTASAGPWILAGALLLSVSILGVGANRIQLGLTAVLPIGSLALSMMAVATRATRQIDSRIAIAGVTVAAMFGAGFYVGARDANAAPIGKWLQSLSDGSVGAASAVLVGLALLAVAFGAPRLLRLVERPIPQAATRELGSEVTRVLRRWCPPTLWRGVTLTVVPALVLGAMACTVLLGLGLLWWVRIGDASVIGPATPAIVCLVVLFFGAGVISGHCREDAEAGRLNLLRLTSDRPLALVDSIGSLWLPFALTATIVWGLAAALLQELPAYLPVALLVVGLMGPLAAVEGWCRYLPFGLVAPIALFVVMKLSEITESWSIGAFVFCLAAIGWIPWAMAREALRNPEQPSLRDLPASLAVAGMTFAVFWPPLSSPLARSLPLLQALALAVFMLYGGSWLVVPRSTVRRHLWAPPLATVIVVVAVLATGGGYATREALAVAAIPAAGLWIGRRIPELLLDRPKLSTMLRAALAITGIMATSTLATMAILRVDARPDLFIAWVRQQELVSAATLLALVVLVEVWRYLLLRRHERIAVVARR